MPRPATGARIARAVHARATQPLSIKETHSTRPSAPAPTWLRITAGGAEVRVLRSGLPPASSQRTSTKPPLAAVASQASSAPILAANSLTPPSPSPPDGPARPAGPSADGRGVAADATGPGTGAGAAIIARTHRAAATACLRRAAFAPLVTVMRIAMPAAWLTSARLSPRHAAGVAAMT